MFLRFIHVVVRAVAHALLLASSVASRGCVTVGLPIQSFPRLTTLAESLHHRATVSLGVEGGSDRPYLSNSTPTILISHASYTAHEFAQPLFAYLQRQAAHSLRRKHLLKLASLAC